MINEHEICNKSFNPRAPCGARRYLDLIPARYEVFQSTRPVRGATSEKSLFGLRSVVSIHAPRAGRDRRGFFPISKLYEFQSTRPVRGATGRIPRYVVIFIVSIHAPRAGRDHGEQQAENVSHVSIHAPRAGRDRQ